MRSVQNCAGDDAIVKVENGLRVTLTTECTIKVSGCADFKGFSTATAHYVIKKGILTVKRGSEDVCARLAEMPADLKAQGAPDKCPVAANRVCVSDYTIDISQYKQYLPLARGRSLLDINVDHDTGKSCFRVEADVNKSWF